MSELEEIFEPDTTPRRPSAVFLERINFLQNT